MSQPLIPPNAIPVWTNGNNLYTALPGPDGILFPIRYPHSAHGLQQLLGLIRTNAFDPRDPTISRAYLDPTFRTKSSPEQLAAAERVLRKMKMLP